MKIRNYLALSNLVVVCIVVLGAVVLTLLTVRKVAQEDLNAAESAGKDFAKASYQLTKKALTAYGEKLVELQAEKAAIELSHLLKRRKSYDLDELRKDEKLRAVGTQEILTSDGVAGYITVGDRTGLSVLHPNRSIEGKNFSEWADEYPDLWKYVKRSFTDPKVKGYYAFVDRNNQRRNKFIVMTHVPDTPFTVAAVVNIDQYFLPVHKSLRDAQTRVMAKAKQSIRDSSRSTISEVKTTSAVGGAILLVVGTLVGAWAAAMISRPVTRLRDGVFLIGKGDFTAEVAEPRAAELKELARSFNQLGKQLTEYIEKRDFIRDTFGRYLTQEVVNRLLESKDGLQLGGESREISLIMSDLRGFTSMTSTMAPEQVIRFLNRYLGKMVEILSDHKGVVDEIIGDGIMAFFGAPDPLDDHPAQAVACALSMQKAMEEINKANEAEGLPHLEMGIAVNTGTVVVGNIGSEKRAKYGAVGSQVNFTGRIESFTVGGQVLISESTYGKLQSLIRVADKLEVEMKGVPGKVSLYDVRGIGDPYDVQLPDRQDETFELAKPAPVVVQRLDQKTVKDSGIAARITHAGPTVGILKVSQQIEVWEDLKIILVDKTHQQEIGEMYGKVVSVTRQEDNFRATVRFTSVSTDASKRLRHLSSQAKGEQERR